MLEFDVVDGIGRSANDVRWQCLLDLTKLLSEGEIELEQLMKEIEQRDPVADHLPHGFNKGKRSPRQKKVAFVPLSSHDQSLNDVAARTGKNLGLKLIFKTDLEKISDVVCTQEPVSKNLDKNPRKRMINSEEEEGTSKKRTKKNSEVLEPVPDLPHVFKNRIIDCGGDLESVVLIIQKELTKTDLSRGHGRLSVPYKKVRNEFLKASEVDQSNTEKGGIQTALIQPCLEECEISLRNWKSNTEYVLVRDWNKVCSRNALREGMTIQLWSFRTNSDRLCFVLVKVE